MGLEGPMALKCPKCGKQTLKHAIKCPECGEPFVPEIGPGGRQGRDAYTCPKCGTNYLDAIRAKHGKSKGKSRR